MPLMEARIASPAMVRARDAMGAGAGLRSDGGGRRVQAPRCPNCGSLLSPSTRSWLRLPRAVLCREGRFRREFGRFEQSGGRLGSALVSGGWSGGGDVQRHHRVASELATDQRLLCHHPTEQIRVTAEGTLESRAQPGTPDGLGRVGRQLPYVVANEQVPLRSPSTGFHAKLVWGCRCRSSRVHRGR
jgi:hypothetical protein